MVVAALTVLRAFHVAGRPALPKGINALGHSEWENTVRAALIWLDEPDPAATTTQLEDDNYESDVFVKVLAAISRHFGERWVATPDILEAGGDDVEITDDTDTQTVQRLRTGRKLVTTLKDLDLNSARTLGQYLSKHKDSMTGFMRLERSNEKNRTGYWRYRIALVHEFG